MVAFEQPFHELDRIDGALTKTDLNSHRNLPILEKLEQTDGAIRLTVDRNQIVWDQRYKPKPNYNHRANLCKTMVVEVKFDRDEQAYASEIIQGIPLRVSRNSKYMIGVHSISMI